MATFLSTYLIQLNSDSGETLVTSDGFYKWITSAHNHAMRLDYCISKKTGSSGYYKIYLRPIVAFRMGGYGIDGYINYTINYTIGNTKKPITVNRYDARGVNTKGETETTVYPSSHPNAGQSTGCRYYALQTHTVTLKASDYKSTIGVNGSGLKVSIESLIIDFDGNVFQEETLTPSKTISFTLPSIVSATKANFKTFNATGKHRSIDVTWETDVNISSNLQYSTDNGSTYTTKQNTSGTKSGSFTISSLQPGTKYDVKVKVTHDNLATYASGTTTTYTKPTFTLSNTNVSIGLNDTSKSISVSVSNPSKYTFATHAELYNGTAISDSITSSVSSGNITIPLKLDVIRDRVTSSMDFDIEIVIYTNSEKTNLAYGSIKLEGTITINKSAANISFTDSNFVVSSSTSDIAVEGGTLGNKLLIRSISQLSVQMKALATTSAGSLVYTVEVKNSSDNVVKSQTLTDTSVVNIGSLSAQGTYSVALTITNTTYETYKTVVVSDIYVSEYSKPSVFGTVVKTQTAGTFLMTFSAQYSTIKNASGDNVNILQEFSYYYKQSTNSSYTLGENLKTGYTFTLYGTTYQLENKTKNVTGFSTTSKFNFRFKIKDSIQETTYDVNVTEAGSILRILTNGQVGINVSPDTSTPNVMLTVGGDALINGDAKAKSHANVSLAELKTDISLFKEDIESIIENTDVYNYKFKDDVKNGNDRSRIGFIIGDNYNTYEGIINDDHTAIDLYSCIGLLWKSQQKIYEELKSIKSKLNI